MKHIRKFNENSSEDFSYWEINYISCEGNKRWTIARTPSDWDEYEVGERISMRGSIGDDPAEITSIHQTWDDDYSWDFTQ